MIYQKNNSMKIGYVQERSMFWVIALTLFFAVSLNYDWRASYIAWYGSLVLLVCAYIVVFNGKSQANNYNFFMWFFSFVCLGVLSCGWALSPERSLDVIKSFAVYAIVLFLIQLSLNKSFSINIILRCYIIATVINAIYVIIKIDLTQIGELQIGKDLIEGWNGNGIGFMAVQGALMAFYLLGEVKNKAEKFFCAISVVFLSFLTVYTGSRTAFIMFLAGLILFFWLKQPKKIMRNVFVTLIVLIVVFYLIMSVESLYKVLGSRIEGLIAMFKGESNVDSSAALRDTYIENGKRWFIQNPILGYGLNNYKMLNVQATGRFTYSHNTYIELAVNLGIIGLVLYYSVYIYLIIALVKTFKKSKLNLFLLVALLASLVSQFGTVSYYGLYQNFLLLLCFFAINKVKAVDKGNE